MPCSRGGLSLGVPPSSLAWDSSDQSPLCQRVHIGGLVEGCSSGLLSEGTLTQSDSATWLTLSSVGGTVGGVLHMFSQNRHYWTPPKWLSSSAVFQLAAYQRSDVSSCGPLGVGPRCGMSPGWPKVENAETSSAGAVPLRSAQMMGQLKKKKYMSQTLWQIWFTSIHPHRWDTPFLLPPFASDSSEPFPFGKYSLTGQVEWGRKTFHMGAATLLSDFTVVARVLFALATH